MKSLLRGGLVIFILLALGAPLEFASAQAPTPTPLTWPGYHTGHGGHIGERFSYYCPPFDPSKGYMLGSNLYGTDMYSDDSGICVAAVHAGVIRMTIRAGADPANLQNTGLSSPGGYVTIEIHPSPGSYTGSTKNGLASKNATEDPAANVAYSFGANQPPPSAGSVPAQTAPCSNSLETLTVSSHSQDTLSSKTVLQNGQTYTVVASGIVGLFPNTNTGFDALYDYRTAGKETRPAFEAFIYVHDKPLTDWMTASGDSIAYRSDHIYVATIPGDGQPLAVKFYETGDYNDNGGDLTIQLCAGGSAPTGMSLQAPRRLALPGELLLIPVSLNNAANVANLNFDLEYDPAVIKIEGAPDKGDLLDNALFSANPTTAGLLHAGFAQTSGTSGSGTVLNVIFRITGKPGNKTPLALRVTTINDPGGAVLNIAQLSGEIDVTNPDGTLPGGGGVSGASCQQQMETLAISSQTPATATSKTVLTSGQDYTVIVSGVVGLFPNTNTGFDALYDYRKPGQEGRVNLDAPANDSLLVVDGQWLSDLVTASGGSIAYHSDHTYGATLTGRGQPMTVKFSDWGSYADNAGSLSIKLCAGGGGSGLNAPVGIPRGDCDGDLKLTEIDALCALEMSIQLRPVQIIMDMDNSGDVTSRDAVIILQTAVGK